MSSCILDLEKFCEEALGPMRIFCFSGFPWHCSAGESRTPLHLWPGRRDTWYSTWLLQWQPASVPHCCWVCLGFSATQVLPSDADAAGQVLLLALMKILSPHGAISVRRVWLLVTAGRAARPSALHRHCGAGRPPQAAQDGTPPSLWHLMTLVQWERGAS